MEEKKDYKVVTDPEEVLAYISDAPAVAFDYETSPDEGYRDDDKAALDPAKSHICTMSLSTAPYSGIMIPVAHKAGEKWTHGVRELRREFLTDKKRSRSPNLSFESMFSYRKSSRGRSTTHRGKPDDAEDRHGVQEKLSDSGLKTLSANAGARPMLLLKMDGRQGVRRTRPAEPENHPLQLRGLRQGARSTPVNGWFNKYLPGTGG